MIELITICMKPRLTWFKDQIKIKKKIVIRTGEIILSGTCFAWLLVVYKKRLSGTSRFSEWRVQLSKLVIFFVWKYGSREWRTERHEYTKRFWGMGDLCTAYIEWLVCRVGNHGCELISLSYRSVKRGRSKSDKPHEIVTVRTTPELPNNSCQLVRWECAKVSRARRFET